MPQLGWSALYWYGGAGACRGDRADWGLLGAMEGNKQEPNRSSRGQAGLQGLTKKAFSFSGKKQDTWFIVDPKSGEKQTTLSTEAWDGLCPSSPLLYIGRTRKPVLCPHP